MRIFWHFLSSNFKYNKIELGISYIICFIVILAFELLKDPKNSDGEILFSVAFYGILYAFYSNKRKFNLKYLISLPLSKNQLLFTKVASDIIYFIPAVVLAFWGVIHSSLNLKDLNKFLLVIMLVELVLIISFIMFDSDIEQPRLENAKSSFLNRLVYVRKMINFFFFSTLVIYMGVFVTMLPLSMRLKEYFLIIFMLIMIFFKFHKSLKLMKDESLSYFKLKRDLFSIGWKVTLYAIPILYAFLMNFNFSSKYGDENVFGLIKREDKKGLISILDKIPKNMTGRAGYSVVDAAIDVGNVEILELLLKKGHSINWKSQLKNKNFEGMAPIHLAIHSGNLKMVKKILEIKPESINARSKRWKTTPLQMSAMYCHPDITEFLLSKEADLNDVNSLGNSALILSAKNKCFASMAILLEYGAKAEIKNKDGKTVLSYINDRDRYLVTRKVKGAKASREVANSTGTKEFPKFLPPKLLPPQKLQN